MTIFLKVNTISELKSVPAIKQILVSANDREFVLVPEETESFLRNGMLHYSLKGLYYCSEDGVITYPDTYFKKAEDVTVKAVTFEDKVNIDDLKLNLNTISIIILACGRFIWSDVAEESVMKLSSIGLLAYMEIAKKILFFLSIGIISFTVWRLPHVIKMLQPALYHWIFITNISIFEKILGCLGVVGLILTIGASVARIAWELKEEYAETLFLDGKL